ncbi:lipoyl(octanoyl) transferase LipB [Paenibacillus sp. JSM ZJ436]|uniref:lipoyl(octanoyl) transferase LipB n=1 Tax=Paenibacillus sp. JSM ZJ436 TaxID=3376190 RepID=UPI00379779EA
MTKVLDVTYTPQLDYAAAWDLQKARASQIDQGQSNEALMLLQHPPTYTMGSQRHPEHLLLDERELKERGITLFEIDRGGDITYHGPGQLVGYPLLLLEGGKQLDLHGYLRSLEQVIMDYLEQFGIQSNRKPEYTGVWVGDAKICAIGVKFNKARQHRGFITSHGFALNIKDQVKQEGFAGIVPCGIQQYGITSLEECIGGEIDMEEAAREITACFTRVFPYEAKLPPDWS